MGDPLDEGTEIGPQARPDLRDELHSRSSTRLRRARGCCSAERCRAGKGSFYPPTVLADVKPGMPAYDEELFGPVAAIISARDEDRRGANRQRQHFRAGSRRIHKRCRARRTYGQRDLEAGCTFVNTLVASDPRLPFGGIKEAGYGRELGSYGIKEFVNIKTVYMK